MIKKSIFLTFLLLFGFYFNVVNANFDNLEGLKKDCFILMQNENKDFDFNNFKDNTNSIEVNDGITGLNFGKSDDEKNIFSSENYYYGNNSELLKGDLYKDLRLYSNKITNTSFYEKEINFRDILNNNKNEFLSCSFVVNENLNGNINDLKKGDVVQTYEPYQNSYSISDFDFNNNKWKKVISTYIYKDKTGKNDILKINSTTFIPFNDSLISYYNLYELSGIYGDILKDFKDKLNNKLKNISNFKEIYNSGDGIIISRYDFGNNREADEYGIKYLLLNGINYFVDFTEYKRNKIFDYLVKNNSSLIEDLYGLEYDLNNRKSSLEDFIFWVNYSLGNIDEIPLDLITYKLYYNNNHHILMKNYYKVSDKIDFDDYSSYVYTNIFNDTEQRLNKIKSEIINNNFSDLLGKYDNFITEYDTIKNSEDNNIKTDFINKYKELFSNDKIFSEFVKEQNLKINNNINDDNLKADKLLSGTKLNINYIYLLVLLLIVIFSSTFYFTKSNKKEKK